MMVIQENAQITEAHFNEAKQSAYSLLDKLDSSLTYHNKEHTTNFVVPASLRIADAERFSLEDKFLVGIAAAFHDTGFVKQYNSNEELGANFAEEYMKKSCYTYTRIQVAHVKNAIENTNLKFPPQTKYEKVLRDADLSYFGLDNSDLFLQLVVNLQKECKLHPESPLHMASQKNKSWGQLSLKFMLKHRWFTKSAELLYEQNKLNNIIALKEHYHLE